nr:MAG TPA: Putative ATP dependent Clp protease [Caudoviricetes sp.]
MLKIENKAESNAAEIYINGTIIDNYDARGVQLFDDGENYAWPADLKKQLDDLKGKDLTVYINSPGGNVFAGVAMANFLKRHDGKTTAVVDGWCCSIATEIFFTCQTRKIPANAYLMIHKPSVAVQGTSDDLLKAADMLDTIQSGIESVYQAAAREGVTAQDITDMVNAGTWLTGDEAANYFNVEVMQPLGVVACVKGETPFRHAPKNITLKDANDAVKNRADDKENKCERLKVSMALIAAEEALA